MKKRLCVFLSLLMVFGALFAFAPGAGAAKTETFVPVFRFLASSDTHVRDDSDVTLRRIGKMLALGYEIADADKNHPTLDAVLICGDLTNDGTKTEFDRFWAAVDGAKRADTRFLGVVAKNHDGYEMSRQEMRGYYESLTGNQADFHVVIGGYHFIGISASPKDAVHYDTAQLSWLRTQLDAAVAEDPAKPVFVMHHEHNRGTVYGSSLYDGWGVTYFKNILKDYPQVVDFSGHSHYPLNDPRSVWQGAYTAIGTGAIYYSEFTVEGERTYHPADAYDTATCWLVELNAQNDVRLTGYDVEAGAPLCTYLLKNPADTDHRDFTPKKRKAASAAPVLDGMLVVTPGEGSCTVRVEAARGGADDPVVLYKAEAVNALGIAAADTWVMPCYYRAVEPEETVELTLEGLADGEYTIRVTAQNAWGKESAPLQAKVTVAGEGALWGVPARIAKLFQRLFDFFRSLF